MVMYVLASPGLRVPKEGKPKDHITDQPPEGEPGYAVADDSAYYQRRLADGDLVVVAAAAETAPAPSKPKKGGA
jgi:hypothetical protein